MRVTNLLPVIILFCPLIAHADWQVVTHTNTDNNTSTDVAFSVNDAGYSTEIYQDSKGVVRLRFSMHKNQHRLDPDLCPTYQVDNRPAENRSINDAVCIGHEKWAEFILGYVIDNVISSTLLLNIMQGNNIHFRFRLKNPGYDQTEFSLAGSSNALTNALGEHLDIVASKQ